MLTRRSFLGLLGLLPIVGRFLRPKATKEMVVRTELFSEPYVPQAQVRGWYFEEIVGFAIVNPRRRPSGEEVADRMRERYGL